MAYRVHSLNLQSVLMNFNNMTNVVIRKLGKLVHKQISSFIYKI
jgi:hypothetical protein